MCRELSRSRNITFTTTTVGEMENVISQRKRVASICYVVRADFNINGVRNFDIVKPPDTRNSNLYPCVEITNMLIN